MLARGHEGLRSRPECGARRSRPFSRARPSGLAGLRPPAIRTVFPDAPIVVISIDTLRADHLPLYGYGAGSTPDLDRLGREGIVFDDVYSHCPADAARARLAAHRPAAPAPRRARQHRLHARARSTPRSPRASRPRAVRTGAAVSAYVLRATTGHRAGLRLLRRRHRGGRGHGVAGQRSSATAPSRWTRSRAGSARRRGARFFAFLHLYEPHTPYAPAAAPPRAAPRPTTARSPTRTSWSAG